MLKYSKINVFNFSLLLLFLKEVKWLHVIHLSRTMTIHGFKQLQELKWTLNITSSILLPLRDQMPTIKIPATGSNGLCANSSSTEPVVSEAARQLLIR